MTKTITLRTIIACLGAIAGCARRIKAAAIPGTYVASYPFGKETLVLHGDGSLEQHVTITGQGSQTFRGTWRYQSQDGRIWFRHLNKVADGFGNLNADWRTDIMDTSTQPVEQLLSKQMINSDARYPYVKQM